MKKLQTALLGLAIIAFGSIALADDSASPEGTVIEIYGYTGDKIFFDEAPTLDEIKENGERLFSDSDIDDLKPIDGMEGRFKVEVAPSGKKRLLEMIASGFYEGEVFLVIYTDGKPVASGLHFCAGCRAMDGWFAKDELDEIRKTLARRTSRIQSGGEQGGADQSATAPESKPDGNQNPKPESDARPQ